MVPDEKVEDEEDRLWDIDAAFTKAILSHGYFDWYRPYLLADTNKHLIEEHYMRAKAMNFT